MAARSRWAAVAAVVAVILAVAASAAFGDDDNGVYEPCADAAVQRGDGFTFGVAFAGHDAFFSGGVQLSPCDGRLALASRSQVALFRPKVDEISLLTVNGSSSGAGFDPASAGGYMVAFAGRKYAARSFPVFVSNSSYTVTSFTLVFEFQKGTLENLYWKTDGCSSCSGSGQSSFACVDQSCAIKTSSCKGKGGQVDCSPGIQLAFSGTDKHDAVLNSWYEVSKLRQYSLFGLFSNIKDSLTSQFSQFF